MIRGAVLHLLNEQPLLVDLMALPQAGDTCVVCTNVRLTSGKRPAWVAQGDHWFVFPLGQVRFVEVPAEMAQADRSDATAAADRRTGAGPEAEPELEFDEELLRRIRET